MALKRPAERVLDQLSEGLVLCGKLSDQSLVFLDEAFGHLHGEGDRLSAEQNVERDVRRKFRDAFKEASEALRLSTH